MHDPLKIPLSPANDFTPAAGTLKKVLPVYLSRHWSYSLEKFALSTFPP
jgi:hypothetical protein